MSVFNKYEVNHFLKNLKCNTLFKLLTTFSVIFTTFARTVNGYNIRHKPNKAKTQRQDQYRIVPQNQPPKSKI